MDEFASVKVVEVKAEEEEAPKVTLSLLGDHPDGYIQDSYCQTGNQTNEIKVEDGAFTGTVVQITNVSPQATLQQMATLFGFLGTIVDIRLYPTEEEKQVAVKLCYVKFDTSDVSAVAQHLTNTVFIDKALIVVPLNITEIPEEGESCQLLTSINAFAGLSTTFMSAGPGAAPVSFPTPPVITSTYDPTEVDAIKRTVFIENIDEGVTSSQLLAFFSGVGEIKYMRLCKQAEEGKYAFIEFSQVESVMAAMQYNGVIFGGRALKVNYAKSGIKKPDPTQVVSGRGGGTRMGPTKQPSRSRSRSPRRRSRRSKSRSKSRSRSKRRRSRSRSKSASRRKRSLSRTKRSRSRDRSTRRKRSRSRSKKRSKSRSGSRSKSKKRSKRSRTKSKSPRRKKKSRSRSPRKRRSRSRSSDKKKKDKKEKEREKDKKGDKEKSSKDKEKSSKDKEKDSSVKKED